MNVPSNCTSSQVQPSHHQSPEPECESAAISESSLLPQPAHPSQALQIDLWWWTFMATTKSLSTHSQISPTVPPSYSQFWVSPPRSFPDHSQLIPNSVPGYSQVIPRLFPGHSQIWVSPQVTPRSFPDHSQVIPRLLPGYSQVIPRFGESALEEFFLYSLFCYLNRMLPIFLFWFFFKALPLTFNRCWAITT